MTFRECQDKPIYSEGLPKKAGGGGGGGGGAGGWQERGSGFLKRREFYPTMHTM